jgi:hypothetical protein
MRLASFVIRWKVAIARTRWTPERSSRGRMVPLTLLTFGYVTATRIPDGTSMTADGEGRVRLESGSVVGQKLKLPPSTYMSG